VNDGELDALIQAVNKDMSDALGRLWTPKLFFDG
jgi:hypothetical protein